MTHRLGRIKREWVATHGRLTDDGVSLKATNHLTEPRSYAGTPAAVPAQIYTDEDCSNMPQPGPRNFAERSYAGVYGASKKGRTGPKKTRLKGRSRRRKKVSRPTIKASSGLRTQCNKDEDCGKFMHCGDDGRCHEGSR